jgi:peptidoglycan hydrolase-like protein with peptidoglycan-binding domain
VWVAALQRLINCAGYGDLETDGVFGPKTAGAVAQAQEAFGRSPTGEPDDAAFGLISRECERNENLDIEDGGNAEVAGNAWDDDPDRFFFGVQRGTVVTLQTDADVSLTVQGDAGDTFSSENGRLVYESPAAQVVTLAVAAPVPTTYLVRVDLTAGGGQGESGTTVVAGPFETADWIGVEWSGDPPAGLVEAGGATDCVGEDSGSPCHDYYGTIVAGPGAFTGSGADNPVEAMGWLLRDTGAREGDHALWEIVDAVVIEAPVGDAVLEVCYPQGADRMLVAWADIVRGTVTGAIRWDWVTREIEVVAPDRIVCVDGAGDQVAVGPGFG